MNQVQLTAINPEDSSVVPVACNDRGQILLEDPLVVEGPPGKDGEDGKDGAPGKDGEDGKDGQDAASFVPSPNGVQEGYVLTADGSNGCRWDEPPAGAAYTKWSTLIRPMQNSYMDPGRASRAFDGSTDEMLNVSTLNPNMVGFEWYSPVDIYITSARFHFAKSSGSLTIFWQSGMEAVTVRPNQWTECPRIANALVTAGANWTFLFDNETNCELAAMEFNGQILVDNRAFPQMQEFQLEASIKSDPMRYRQLIWSEKDEISEQDRDPFENKQLRE